MDGIIILIFLGFVFFNFIKGGKKTKPVKTKQIYKGAQNNGSNVWGTAKQLNAAGRAAKTGSATAATYKKLNEKRRDKDRKTNIGLWNSKHRVDHNRNRRTDWGSRGESAMLSPKMIAITGGALVTAYFVITALAPL